ncbi:MGMT family protein [bacterium]|nr:MGMT family protein [bacterium]
MNEEPDYTSTHARIYEAVRRVPRGRVATYGQIAKMAGMPGQARLVGYALHALPETMDVPWHRIINAKGEISLLPDPDSSLTQRMLLESEGIVFDARGRVALDRYVYRP